MTAEEAVLKAEELFGKQFKACANEFVINTVKPVGITSDDDFYELSESQFNSIRKRIAKKLADLIENEYIELGEIDRKIKELNKRYKRGLGSNGYYQYSLDPITEGNKLKKQLYLIGKKIARDESIFNDWADTIVTEVQKEAEGFNVSYTLSGDNISFNVVQTKQSVQSKSSSEVKEDKEVVKEAEKVVEKMIEKEADDIKKETEELRKRAFNRLIKVDVSARGLYTEGKKGSRLVFDENENVKEILEPYQRTGKYIQSVDISGFKLWAAQNARPKSQHNLNPTIDFKWKADIKDYFKNPNAPIERSLVDIAKYYGDMMKQLRAQKGEDYENLLYSKNFKSNGLTAVSESYKEILGNKRKTNFDYNGIEKIKDKDYEPMVRELIKTIEELKGDFIGGKVLENFMAKISPEKILELYATENEEVFNSTMEELKKISERERKKFARALENFKDTFTDKEGNHPLKGALIKIYPILLGNTTIDEKSGNEIVTVAGKDITDKVKKLGKTNTLKASISFNEIKDDNAIEFEKLMGSSWGGEALKNGYDGLGLKYILLNKRKIKVDDIKAPFDIKDAEGNVVVKKGDILPGGKLDKAEIKQVTDTEAIMVYSMLLRIAAGNIDLVKCAMETLSARYSQIQSNLTMEMARSGQYAEIIDPETNMTTFKKISELTDYEKKYKGNQQRVDAWIKRNAEYLLAFNDGDFSVGSLKEDMKQELAVAEELWKQSTAEILAKIKEYNQGNLPEFPKQWIEEKLDNLVYDIKNKTLFGQYKKLNKRASTRNKIRGTSAQLGVGIKNIFTGGFDISVRYATNATRGVLTSTKECTLPQEKREWTKITKKQLLIRRSSLKDVDVRYLIPKKGKVRSFLMDRYDKVKDSNKKGVLPFIISKKWIEEEYALENYGISLAAGFFQLLVSNTPIDEPYHWTETRKYRVKGKAKKTEIGYAYEDPDKPVKVALPGEEIFEQWDRGEVRTKVIERYHEPDSDVVRNDWEFNYKNVIFKPTEFSEDLFIKPGDPESVAKIVTIFKERTKNSKIKTHNFTYKNTNKRWEQLEYGGYKTKNSGPWKGEGKYGKKHGLTNQFTWQAPHGWLRIIEAQWNMILEEGGEFDFLSKLISRNTVSVEELGNELIKKLQKYDSSINTHNYDLQNWILIEGDV